MNINNLVSFFHRFLATGNSYKSLAFSYRIGASTVGEIIPQVCDTLWEHMIPTYMAMPKNEDTWKIIAQNFEHTWNFPHCIGAIDGKHVVIKAPANSGSLHYNYKGTFSTVLMAMVDANYKFIHIDVGSYGRNSDGGIFSHSSLGRALKSNTLNIPDDEPLKEAPELGPVPYVIIGDEAFPLMTNLMRPFPRSSQPLSEDKHIFNYRLSRARRIVENAFGILACRWRLYHTKMMVSPTVVNKIVKATCVLHNYLQITSTTTQIASVSSECNEDPEGKDWLCQLTKSGNRASTEATQIRDTFATYFMGAGKVDWQTTIIRRGVFRPNNLESHE